MPSGTFARRWPAWSALALLAACTTAPAPSPSTSSASPTTTTTATASDSVTASGSASATDPSATVTATTGGPTATGSVTAAPTVALPTAFIPVNQVIKDPDLGHEIKVNRIVRGLPWPDGYAGSAAAYELVGVEMTWTPGITYTAAIRQIDFAIATGSQFPNRPDPLENATLQAAGWPLLPPEMPNGQNGTAWLVFKVDPKDAASMRLDFTRPASRVTDTNRTFPKKVFSVQLVGPTITPSPTSVTTG